MRHNPSRVYLSAIDEKRFGIRTARASNVTLDILPSIIDFSLSNGVVLLIARCSTSDLRVIHEMEQEKFNLMDTLVYYARNLKKQSIPSDIMKVAVRRIRTGDEDNVKIIAADSFSGYYGHYHSDERLDPAKCDEAYVSWAINSCKSRSTSSDVLIAEVDNSAVGFITLLLNHSGEGECGLFCVAKPAQGQGVSQSLMIHGLDWCLSKGAQRMIISTQIINIASQKVWVRLGFEPIYSYHTFHKWFDKP